MPFKNEITHYFYICYLRKFQITKKSQVFTYYPNNKMHVKMEL